MSHFPIWKCIVRSKSDHNDRMQCPVLYIMKELKLTIEYPGRYEQKLIQKTFAISSKIFTVKLQFLHNTVAHIQFFPSCHFQTLKYLLIRSERSLSPKEKMSISLFGNALKGPKMTTMIECSVPYYI